MNRLRRTPALFLLALVPLAACARSAVSGAADQRVTVANVGVIPERPDVTRAAAPYAANAGDSATTADTTEPSTTGARTAPTTDPDETAPASTGIDADASGSNDDETDPARRAWLEFTERADPDSVAGGADISDLVDGRRVLMIGDSVMASTSSRYGGEMCDTLVPDGWQVEVDAETGRFVDFGDIVLDQRLAADFDVAVIMLGNNYGADPEVYEKYLRDIVDRLEPRPTLLSTVTVFQANRSEVNAVIYDIARDHDNVGVIDWAGETAEERTLTAGDGLHLSDLGRARFAEMVAEGLGDAPGFGDGDCLASSFRDDSAGQDNTGPTEGQVTMPPSTSPSGAGDGADNGGGGGGGGGNGGGGSGGGGGATPVNPPAPPPPPVETSAGGGGEPPPEPEPEPPPEPQPEPDPPPPPEPPPPPPPPPPPEPSTT